MVQNVESLQVRNGALLERVGDLQNKNNVLQRNYSLLQGVLQQRIDDHERQSRRLLTVGKNIKS